MVSSGTNDDGEVTVSLGHRGVMLRLLTAGADICDRVSWQITRWCLGMYYTKTWVMQLYFRLVPPCKQTWCALMRFKDVNLPAQNIWRRTLQSLSSFQARGDDVYVVTFPKSGTHMIVPLVTDLLWSNNPNWKQCKQFANSSDPGHYPLFLEFGHPRFKYLDMVQPGTPRVFQTHLPCHLFPQDALGKGCKIIYLTRDPRACTVSALHFCRNKRRKLHEPSVEELVDSEWNESLQLFGGWHRHVAEWVRLLQKTETSLVLCYEDLVRDPAQAVRDLRAFLNVQISEEEVQALVSRNSIHARRGDASAADKKYFRRGAPGVDAEWYAEIPEASRLEVRRLCAERWTEHCMDALLAEQPALRRYQPKAKRGGPIRRVVIAGLGFHCKRIYLPPLRSKGVELALVVDLESEREHVLAWLREQQLQPRDLVWVPTSSRSEPTLPAHVASALAAADADGIIISSDPLAHEPYLRWALENDVDVLVDKPPIIPSRFQLSAESAHRIAADFEEVLQLAARSAANAMVMSQRRAHPGYRFVHAYLSRFVREWKVPISFMDVYHADGMWCMPGEMCTRDYHPYKHGYGKLMFSGYHFADLMMWLLSINDERHAAAGSRPAEQFRVQCAKFCPRDALEQLEQERLEALLLASAEEVEASLAEVPADLSTLGELNVHALVQSLAASGTVECTASLNLLHNSFSRRAWFQPRPDLYKGNGRVRHERLVVQVGPLLSLHLHSYQTGTAADRTSSVHDGAKAEEEEGGSPQFSPTTRELLLASGLGAPRADGQGDAYAAGHEEHFDVTIYRNAAVVGGPAVETIPIGRFMMQQGPGADGAWLGHNERARHILLEEWLRRADCGGLSPLVSQRATMQMLSRLYQQLASL